MANQHERVKIVETGETIQMTAPDQMLLSGVLQSAAVASVHLKGGTISLVAYLASPEAGFVTGASLTIDGGYLA